MKRAAWVVAVLALGLSLLAPQDEARAIAHLALDKPNTNGGKPLMEALRDRHTSREFSDEPLSRKLLSNLLWAAFGVNRPETGKRTAPSAWNQQEIDIYVVQEGGAFLYHASRHSLEPVIAEDIRAMTGVQPFVAEAPVTLVYVADFAKMARTPQEDKVFYSAANTGLIAENVYLFCASEELAVVVRGLIDREPLAKKLELRPEQTITLAQTVGYMKPERTEE